VRHLDQILALSSSAMLKDPIKRLLFSAGVERLIVITKVDLQLNCASMPYMQIMSNHSSTIVSSLLLNANSLITVSMDKTF